MRLYAAFGTGHIESEIGGGGCADELRDVAVIDEALGRLRPTSSCMTTRSEPELPP